MTENFPIMLCIFPLISLAITGVGIWLWIKTRRFQAKSVEVMGTVIGKEQLVSTIDQKGTSYANFQFTTKTGDLVTGRSVIGVPWSRKNKGEQIGILYNPDDPQESRVNSFVELHGATLIFLLVGIGQFVLFWILIIVDFLT